MSFPPTKGTALLIDSLNSTNTPQARMTIRAGFGDWQAVRNMPDNQPDASRGMSLSADGLNETV
jgi:hypothetical protein